MSDRFVIAVMTVLLAVATAAWAVAGSQKTTTTEKSPEAAMKRDAGGSMDVERIERSEAEWRKLLTPEQFHILREEGTERAFTGRYWNSKESGVYVCAGCGLELFRSAEKYDSGTGWPSFWAPVEPGHVKIVRDSSWGMVREEVECARCGGHQGHVFADGPKPTGLRYCINSASLKFEPAEKRAKSAAKK